MQIPQKIKIPKQVKRFLKQIKPYVGGEWDRDDKAIIIFKAIAREQLIRYQNGKCAYCGLKLATRTPELEHIAPKGGAKRPKHTDFTFLPINLVMACRDCNSPRRKGLKNTIALKHQYYNRCQFLIVHPYLDNFNDYFEYIRYSKIDGGLIPIPRKGASPQQRIKAINTIEMFGLNTEEKILARAQERFYEFRTISMSKEINKRIEQISKYKSNSI